MARRSIRRFGDPVLREKCPPVEIFDGDLKELVKDMAETMYEAPGMGLAANQIGVVKRVLVVDFSEDKGELLAFVNPEVVEKSEETEEEVEGCLSLVPDLKMTIRRSAKVKVRAQDLEGRPVTVDWEGMPARVIQHEIDHLDGILAIDRCSREERRKALEAMGHIMR